MGSIQAARGEIEQAAGSYCRSFALAKTLDPKQPKLAVVQAELADSLRRLGLGDARAKKYDQAMSAYLQALPLQEALVAANPQSTSYTMTLGANYGLLAGAAQETGAGTEAVLGWQDKAVHTFDAVLRREPDNRQARSMLAFSLADRAERLHAASRHEAALADWDRAMQLYDGRQREQLRWPRAITLAASGRHAPAAAEVEALTKDPKSTANDLYNGACVLSLASTAAQKDAKLTEDDRKALAARYAVRAVALLKEAVKRGYKDVKHMKKDADLDGVRDLAEFKQLIADLEKSKP
jgi:tetratricopeptide (TPR) repeat protein